MTKPTKEKQKRRDPELARQLEVATKAQHSLQAVFFLRTAQMRARAAPPIPAETESTVRALIERVEKATGERVEDFHVFPSLGSFVVQGSARLVESLIQQDEIASASPNRRSTA